MRKALTFFLVAAFSVFPSAMDANSSQRKLDSSETYFRMFDKDNKGYLNEQEFCELTKFLIENIDEAELCDVFSRFDRNGDNKLDAEEFQIAYRSWIKPLVIPVTALIVVDVQNDFIDGSLAMRNCPAKQEGKEVVPLINQLMDSVQFDVVVYSIDYHPEDHISFYENLKKYSLSESHQQKVEDIKPFDVVTFAGPPEMNQTLWPRHCVQGSWGCELHPDLKVAEDSVFIHKGTNSKIDSYSAFFDNLKVSKTELHSELQKRHVTHIFVSGLALDYCVAFTALDALELGYATVLIEDASRGTDVDNIESMKKKLITSSCVIASSAEIENLATGKDIRLEFARVLKNYQQS